MLASKPAQIRATIAMRLMLIGGDALGEKRVVWWNFVSSRRPRIEETAQAWAGQRMGQVPGETELIALPERRRLSPPRDPRRGLQAASRASLTPLNCHCTWGGKKLR